jgi:hypothetical protein
MAITETELYFKVVSPGVIQSDKSEHPRPDYYESHKVPPFSYVENAANKRCQECPLKVICQPEFERVTSFIGLIRTNDIRVTGKAAGTLGCMLTDFYPLKWKLPA